MRKARVLQIWSLAFILCPAKAPLAVAQEAQAGSSLFRPAERINEILVAIAKLDPKLTIIKTPAFSIESGDLTISVKPDKPIFYDGAAFPNGMPVTGLYGQVEVSDKFYGIEVVLHYLLLKERVPYGGAALHERVTILYEETPRLKPSHPRAFDSKPFAVNKDGTFMDLQMFGRFHARLPGETMQVLKQELVLDNELIATIYIVRTPNEIRLVGYSVPPLISGLVLP